MTPDMIINVILLAENAVLLTTLCTMVIYSIIDDIKEKKGKKK